MTLEQLKAFLEKLRGDPSLQEKLKSSKSMDDVVSIANEHGHGFTADKFSQLSEEELEGVAGGIFTNETICPDSPCHEERNPSWHHD